MSAVLLDRDGRVEPPAREPDSWTPVLVAIVVRSVEAWRWTPAQIVEARLRAAETAALRAIEEAESGRRGRGGPRASASRPGARASRRARRRGR